MCTVCTLSLVVGKCIRFRAAEIVSVEYQLYELNPTDHYDLSTKKKPGSGTLLQPLFLGEINQRQNPVGHVNFRPVTLRCCNPFKGLVLGAVRPMRC